VRRRSVAGGCHLVNSEVIDRSRAASGSDSVHHECAVISCHGFHQLEAPVVDLGHCNSNWALSPYAVCDNQAERIIGDDRIPNANNNYPIQASTVPSTERTVLPSPFPWFPISGFAACVLAQNTDHKGGCHLYLLSSPSSMTCPP
jgi:hypothetical protein